MPEPDTSGRDAVPPEGMPERTALASGQRPGRLETLFYDAFYTLALGLGSPLFVYKIARGKYRQGWAHKLGFVPTRPAGDRIWLHAVSVGEAIAAGILAERLRREMPSLELVASTTTPTGQAVARRLFGEGNVFYFPLDFSGFAARALARTAPSLVVLVELEIWPNLVAAAARAGVPVVVVNGRLSERSFRGYSRIAPILGPTMRRIAAFGVQTEEYAERFRALGAPPGRVTVTGSLKYDGVKTEPDPAAAAWARAQLGLKGPERVLIGGSTHRTEELALARAWRELGERTAWRLVIAPRHPERVPEVEEELAREGIRTVRRTALGHAGAGAENDKAVVIVDTVGELGRFYHAADLVFVGGSLIPHGGQNPIEPAGIGKATIFGPHMFNFAETVELLLAARGARMVGSREELARAVSELASSEAERARLGDSAREAIRSKQGAAEQSVRLIRNVLAERARRSQNPASPS